MLHFPCAAACLYLLVAWRGVFPVALWVVLFYAVVLGGWMGASLASQQVLGAVLAGKRTGMDPWMQVLLTVLWSIANLVVIGGLAVVFTLALRAPA